MAPVLRQMNWDDIPSCLLLCRNNNWNQLARDWALFLNANPTECRVVVEDEKTIGSVTTFRHGSSFSWIGMLLVDPGYQRKGIGTRLLKESLAILKNEETIKLDATPAGRQLYHQLNFIDEYPLMRMQADAIRVKGTGSSVLGIKENDLARITAYDQVIFGASRDIIVRHFWEGANETAFYVQEDNAIKGYCLGRPGYKFIQIGPVVADNVNSAVQVVTAALQNCVGQKVVIDTLLHDREWVAWLQEIGFKDQRSFMRMYKGSNRFAGNQLKQYAIAGPEYG